ncbi:hypothetical protein VB773_14625 [Haloarculaceae archaeon H-GB2-1]|nr:hypothetical protein [Haloarculaceae archaeon H-GB11]MEA5408681.1 hypothetical protein [Haloarculaceae archaeon H-GB2-1]
MLGPFLQRPVRVAVPLNEVEPNRPLQEALDATDPRGLPVGDAVSLPLRNDVAYLLEDGVSIGRADRFERVQYVRGGVDALAEGRPEVGLVGVDPSRL